MKNIILFASLAFLTGCTISQEESNHEPVEEQTTDNKIDDYRPIPAKVYFNKPIRAWDGFGVNYVETSQTFYYDRYPQRLWRIQIFIPSCQR